MINLNDEKFDNNIQIFNDGEAGLVKDVTIDRVEKKESSDTSNAPEYKVFYKDKTGAETNQAWFYFKPYPGADEASIEKSRNGELSRIRSIGKAVMGNDFQFPEVKSVEEALDVIVGLVKDNSSGKTFNVYTTYGTTSKPSAYLNVRKYNFIEPSSVEVSTLRPSAKDNMIRLVQDTPVETAGATDWNAL